MTLFFFALTLLCHYFSTHLPCCALIFLRTRLPCGTLLCLYFSLRLPCYAIILLYAYPAVTLSYSNTILKPPVASHMRDFRSRLRSETPSSLPRILVSVLAWIVDSAVNGTSPTARSGYATPFFAAATVQMEGSDARDKGESSCWFEKS